ncbi:DUF2817 domain-containing protein [Salicibibacter halophilus]|uniref:DUF2817 domain-containing protein n=1 Tax=Salicibibacter halophilus TaxID=2502791 RepID=A0A514LFX1_9BACI|nr:M14 family metallopeptidase [Salicibibacter halophilus]QDI90729.1 DUF2817 domain-containing protein [Salicibibacter halophilus]
MKGAEEYFSETYETSRANFRNRLKEVQKIWPSARLETDSIGSRDDDNTTDILAADAHYHPQTLIVITTAVHGAEGYAGAALLDFFIDHYTTQLNPNTVGLRLVHAVNPWGMRHRRRVSENNVDLNRNFIKDWSRISNDLNNKFEAERKRFVPSGSITDLKKERRKFYRKVPLRIFSQGMAGLEEAATMGQYNHPTGIFYGGETYEEPVDKFLSRMEQWTRGYQKVIHIDIHTGLGPANDLWIQVPDADPRKEKELHKSLKDSEINDVQKTDIRRIKGEDAEYIKDVFSKNSSSPYIFSCLLEFGTIGNRKVDQIKALATVVQENQWYWYGAKKGKDSARIKEDFREMFDPINRGWRQAVIKKGRRAIDLILEKEGGISLVK